MGKNHSTLQYGGYFFQCNNCAVFDVGLSFHQWVYGDMIKGKILRFSDPGLGGEISKLYSDFFLSAVSPFIWISAQTFQNGKYCNRHILARLR